MSVWCLELGALHLELGQKDDHFSEIEEASRNVSIPGISQGSKDGIYDKGLGDHCEDSLPHLPLLTYPPAPLFDISEKEVTNPCLKNFHRSREQNGGCQGLALGEMGKCWPKGIKFHLLRMNNFCRPKVQPSDSSY